MKDGQWTFGIFDMWTRKAKVAKQSVHIPCWDRCCDLASCFYARLSQVGSGFVSSNQSHTPATT